MKKILTLDKANQPYGFPQLNGEGGIDVTNLSATTLTANNVNIISGLTATTISATTYLNLPTPHYKVYTALLTQSGGGTPINVGSGTLVIGATYQIVLDSPGMDFTNVGAQNNNLGTWFVATGITPTSWGNLEGDKILYYHPAAPVVTVLENTIGNIWFTYEDIGTYHISSDGLFTINKTSSTPIGGNYTSGVATYIINNNVIVIDNRNGFSLVADGINNIYSTLLEIRVYN